MTGLFQTSCHKSSPLRAYTLTECCYSYTHLRDNISRKNRIEQRSKGALMFDRVTRLFTLSAVFGTLPSVFFLFQMAVVGLFVSGAYIALEMSVGLLNEFGEKLGVYGTFIYRPLMIGISSLLVHKVSPICCGSGVPEIRRLFSVGGSSDDGVDPNILCLETLLIKWTALCLVISGGLNTGLEGPFIHISCCVANVVNIVLTRTSIIKLFALRKLRLWRRRPRHVVEETQHADSSISVRNTESDLSYYWLICGAICIGVTTTFGTPIGAVLFAVEVSNTSFHVSALWRGLASALLCIVIRRIIKTGTVMIPIRQEPFIPFAIPYSPREFFIQPKVLLMFLMVCILASLAAILVIRGLSLSLLFLKRTLINRPGSVRCITTNVLLAIWALIVGLITALLSFAVQDHPYDNVTTIKRLLDPTTSMTYSMSTIVVLFSRSLCTMILTQTAFVPCGVFTPCLLLGALIGKGVQLTVDGNVPSELSAFLVVVGSSCFTASVTHSLSVSIIVIEMMNDTTHSLVIVLLVCTLASYLLTSRGTCSIYDTLGESKDFFNLDNILVYLHQRHQAFGKKPTGYAQSPETAVTIRDLMAIYANDLTPKISGNVRDVNVIHDSEASSIDDRGTSNTGVGDMPIIHDVNLNFQYLTLNKGMLKSADVKSILYANPHILEMGLFISRYSQLMGDTIPVLETNGEFYGIITYRNLFFLMDFSTKKLNTPFGCKSDPNKCVDPSDDEFINLNDPYLEAVIDTSPVSLNAETSIVVGQFLLAKLNITSLPVFKTNKMIISGDQTVFDHRFIGMLTDTHYKLYCKDLMNWSLGHRN